MFKNLAMTLLKKGLYALVGLLIAWIVQSIASFQPDGPTQTALWTYLMVPLLTGLVAVLKRVLTWDPSKLG